MIETDTFSGVISDGYHLLDGRAPFSLDGILSITFYSDEYVTPVLPTGGFIDIQVSDDGFNYGTITNGKTVFPVLQYDRPYFYGYCRTVRAELGNIQGATHFTFRVHSEKGGR